MGCPREIQLKKKNSARPDWDGLELTVLGVYCESGLRQLDCALVRYQQTAPASPMYLKVLEYGQIPVSPSIRTPILGLIRAATIPAKTASIVCLNTLLDGMVSKGISAFCKEHDLDTTTIDLIGPHVSLISRTHDSICLIRDCHALIVGNVGVPVACNFSTMSGKTSSPHISPVTFVEGLILKDPHRFRVCLNIDEVANLCFIPSSEQTSGSNKNNTRENISRNCGSGSILIDYAMRYLSSNKHGNDHNGAFAAKGVVNDSLVDRFLSTHDLSQSISQSSIPLEMFGSHDAQDLIDECLFHNMSDIDTVATITRITAKNILTQYHAQLKRFFPRGVKVDELFICGPSAKNMSIVDYLEAGLPDNVVTRPLDDIGIPGEAKQAVCYAHLALEATLEQVTRVLERSVTLDSPPADVPSDEQIASEIVCGPNWEDLANKVLHFSGGKPLHVTKDIKVVSSL